MSFIEIKYSQEQYETFKKKVLEQTTLQRVDVDSSDIEFNSLTGVSIRGTIIKLESKALKSMTRALGMSKIFVDTINSTFDHNAGVLATIIKAVKESKSKRFSLVYNTTTKSITHVYPEGSKLISDNQYFEVLEKVISKTPGAFLRSVEQLPTGDLVATLSNPKMEFQFGGLPEEVFTAGMTLELTTKVLKTSFFTTRLWCANGNVTTDKLCTLSVKSQSEVPEFMAAILDSDYHINSIAEFKKRINRTYHTTASLAEVIMAEKAARHILGESAVSEKLLSSMSANHLIDAFGPNYLSNKEIHQFLNTDMTLWELVNEVTALSSQIEQEGLPLTENQNRELQVLGGHKLLFKTPDLAPSTIRQKFKPQHRRGKLL